MIDDLTWQNEEYRKDNDYTLSVVQKGVGAENNVNFQSRITRTFNFAAKQVTTATRDITYQTQYSGYGSSSSVAATMTHQRFDQFQSQEEIRMMRDKLVALGGNPPALDDDETKPRLPAPGVSRG